MCAAALHVVVVVFVLFRFFLVNNKNKIYMLNVFLVKRGEGLDFFVVAAATVVVVGGGVVVAVLFI